MIINSKSVDDPSKIQPPLLIQIPSSSVKTLTKSFNKTPYRWTELDKKILNSARVVWDDIRKAPDECIKKFLKLKIKNESLDWYIKTIDTEKTSVESEKICLHIFDGKIPGNLFLNQERKWGKEKIEATVAWQTILGLCKKGHNFASVKNSIRLNPSKSKLTCLEEIAKQLNINTGDYDNLVDNSERPVKKLMWTEKDKEILNSARIVWEDIKKAPIEYIKKFIELIIKKESDLYIKKIGTEKSLIESEKICLHLFDSLIPTNLFVNQECDWKSKNKEKIEKIAAWQNILGLYREGHRFAGAIPLDPNESKLTCLEEIAKQLNIVYPTIQQQKPVDKKRELSEIGEIPEIEQKRIFSENTPENKQDLKMIPLKVRFKTKYSFLDGFKKDN